MKIAIGMFLVLLMLGKINYALALEENVKFSGTLVALPCTIPDADQQIHVHFGIVNAHDIYLGQSMPKIPFVIHLEGCDTSIANKVSMMFVGTESSELPGFLKVDSTKSGANGVAIGLESPDGNKILVNKSTTAYVLHQNDNEFSFRAFVAGEPSAIKTHSIQTGGFSAMAVIQLNYE